MSIYASDEHIPLVRAGLRDSEQGLPDGFDLQLNLLDSGAVQLSLGAGRFLLVLGHPAAPRGLPDVAVRSESCGEVLEVLTGSVTTVILDVRDRHDDPTHVLHRPTGDELVSTGRTVRITSTAVFTAGAVSSRNRTSFIPAGTFSTTESLLGPAALLVQRLVPAVLDPRHDRVAVPIGVRPPPPAARVCGTTVLRGIIATMVPDWRDLIEQES